MIALIAAVSQNGVIGYSGEIPWDIPSDRSHFRAVTLGNILIMGRKTFQSIGRTLDDRDTIVLSKTKKFSGPNLFSTDNLNDALSLADTLAKQKTIFEKSEKLRNEKLSTARDIFFTGGSEVYRLALQENAYKQPLAQKLYITEIHENFDGDTFFPAFDKSKYTKKITEHFNATDSLPAFDFVEYTKKSVAY